MLYIYLNMSHGSITLLVCDDDDVGVLNGSLEDLVHVLHVTLECEQGQVHLVHEQYRLDSLRDGLTQYSFCLYRHA